MYHLSVVTPEAIVFDGTVNSLIAPGGAGYLEILTNHAAIITTLKKGKLTIKDTNGQRRMWNVTGGLLEMFNNEATILADKIENIEVH